MADSFTVIVYGEPTGKGRPRATIRGNHAGMYTPAKTISYEGKVKQAFVDQIGRDRMLDGEINCVITAYFGIPASTTKKSRALMITDKIHPAKKPDCDNIMKICLDALNGLAYQDDKQVVFAEIRKRYAEIPRVEIYLEEVEEND